MHMIGGFLEDFAVGQTFRSGRVRIDTERIKTFGAEFDPQPFHLDEEAARDTIFRGLAASGWHTAAVTMRLLVESDLKPAGGNQNDEAVQVIIANLVVPRRPTQGGAEANMSEHLDPASARVSSKYRHTTAAAPTGDH